MKKVIFNIAIIICFGLTNNAFAQTGQPSPDQKMELVPANPTPLNATLMDTTIYAQLAEKLFDKTTSIGYFESPPIGGRTRSLKDGKFAEEDDKYLDFATTDNITKLNTLLTIKGNFDTVIWVNGIEPSSENQSPFTMYLYPETDWIICLNSCYVSGNPTEWAGRAKNIKKMPYFNESTCYTVQDYTGPNLAVKWTGSNPQPTVCYKVTPTVANELRHVSTLLTKTEALPKIKRIEALKIYQTKPIDENTKYIINVLVSLLNKQAQ